MSRHARLRKVAKLVALAVRPAQAAKLVRYLAVPPTRSRPIASDEEHLHAAIRWLCAAQDAVTGGGVSYGYSLLDGWLSPYPETTGYCIPTFVAFARFTGEDGYRTRARRMGEWELTVQLPDGGIPGGRWQPGTPQRPVSFDTGQVLQGWCALYREESDPRMLKAAIAAGDHLACTQRQDGAWEDTAPGRATATRFAFNTRTSWSLLDLSLITGETSYRSAALRNLDWVLGQQMPDGWFRSAGFSPDEPPLTHTVAYVLEGLLECWRMTRDNRLLDSIRPAALALAQGYLDRQSLPGVIHEGWRLTDAVCVTGCAQMARVWLLLGGIEPGEIYHPAGRAMLDQVKAWQVRGTDDPNIDGALPGSVPARGFYEPFRFPNWGVKFFCDALLTSRGANDPLPSAILTGPEPSR